VATIEERDLYKNPKMEAKKMAVTMEQMMEMMKTMMAENAALKSKVESLSATTPTLKTKVSAKKTVEKTVEKTVDSDSRIPDASEYRLAPEEIDSSVCIARRLPNTPDKRWSPCVYFEKQCGKKVLRDGLCSACCEHKEMWGEYSLKTGNMKTWHGLITEDPPAWDHMLGTAWAVKKCRWVGGDSGSVASGETASTVKTTRSRVSAAKKLEDKEAEKAKKALERDAKALAKAEAKAAELKARIAGGAGSAPAPATVPMASLRADEAAEVEEVDGITRTFQDVTYYLRKSADGCLYVYDFDLLSLAEGEYRGKAQMDEGDDSGELLGWDTSVEEPLDLANLPAI